MKILNAFRSDPELCRPGNDATAAAVGETIVLRLAASLDGVLDFVAFEKHLLVKELAANGQGSLVKSFPATFKAILFILAHAYLWWTMGRVIPCEYLTFTSSGFLMWHIFVTTIRSAPTRTLRLHSTKNTNVKWAHLLVINVFWAFFQVFVGFYITLVFYSLLMPHSIIAWVVYFPDITKLFPILVIDVAMGLGFGLVLQAAKHKWEAAEYVQETLLWIMYVTGGIFEAYSQLPPVIANYFWYNPMLHLTEFTRATMEPFYPDGGLTLIYPASLALVMLIIGFSFHSEHRKEALH